MSTVRKIQNRKKVQQWNAEGTTSRRKNGRMENRNIQPKPTFVMQMDRVISRPHRLMKTSGKQSKRRNIVRKTIILINTVAYHDEQHNLFFKKRVIFIHFFGYLMQYQRQEALHKFT